MTYPACPTPHKRGYDRRSRALHATERVRFNAEIYFCPCGRWHLRTARPAPTGPKGTQT
jgi:hypothetical protein